MLVERGLKRRSKIVCLISILLISFFSFLSFLSQRGGAGLTGVVMATWAVTVVVVVVIVFIVARMRMRVVSHLEDILFSYSRDSSMGCSEGCCAEMENR